VEYSAVRQEVGSKTIYSPIQGGLIKMKVTDKVVVVTGGASGIGRAFCRRFAQEGAKGVTVADNVMSAKKTILLTWSSGPKKNTVLLICFAQMPEYRLEEALSFPMKSGKRCGKSM
jgi:3-oxoacyl-ACP reductase-like protein